MLLSGGPALGQTQRRPAPAGPAAAAIAAPVTVPDQLTVAKLVWTTMAAVDHANKTGNYSVVREIGSPAFQASNTPAALANVFAGLRQQQVDLSNTLLVEPLFEFSPRIEGGLLRMRGAFGLRPTAIQFDLLFEWNGAWRMSGIAIRPLPMAR